VAYSIILSDCIQECKKIMKETLFYESYGYWAWKATETETDKDRKKTLTDLSSWMDWA